MPQARLIAADMAVEVAIKGSLPTDERQALLAGAHDIWKRIQTADQRMGAISIFGASASVGLNTLPILNAITVEGTLPSPKHTRDAYRGLSRTAREVVTLATASHHRGDVNTNREANGMASSLAVNLLLLRHGLADTGPRSGVALPAFLSEKKTGHATPGNPNRSTWNVNLFTDENPQGLKLLRAIKTQGGIALNQNPESVQEQYGENIACVILNPHLALGPGESPTRSIIGCIASEIADTNHSDALSKRLDERTEQLFQILGQQGINPPSISYAS
jgi:hypothetical protein